MSRLVVLVVILAGACETSNEMFMGPDGGGSPGGDAGGTGTAPPACQLTPLAVLANMRASGKAPYAVAVATLQGKGLDPTLTSAITGVWDDIVVTDADANVFVKTNLKMTPLSFTSTMMSTDSTIPPTGVPIPFSASVAIGDVDNDGRNDIVMANYSRSSVGVVLNTKDAFISVGPFAVSNGNPAGIALANIYGHPTGAQLDIAVADMNAGGLVDTFASVPLATGLFKPAVPHPLRNSGSPRSLAVAGLTSATTMDIVVGNKENDSVSVLMGGGDGSFQAEAPPSPYPTDSSSPGQALPVAVAVAALKTDFQTGANANAMPDIIVANSQAGNIGILTNNDRATGKPPFASVVNFTVSDMSQAPVTNQAQSIAVADIDRDGYLDVIVAAPANSQSSGKVVVFFGTGLPGNAAFHTTQATIATDSPQSVAVGDLNGDGKPDIVVVSSTGAISMFSCLSQ